ncbi:MAG TPA: HNH endonuclease, partial [Brachybacterium paraconglomeratum]|nr:HNH endonuclease [Brachybacterium paraconglomeratum]
MGEFDDIDDDDARRDASSETARQSPSSDASSGPGPSSPGPVGDPIAGPAAVPDNGPAVGPAVDPADRSAAPARPAREWRVRARRELTEELILEEVGGIEGKNAGRVLALHSLMREEAQLHARRLRHLADFFAVDPDNAGSLIDADMTAMKVAVGLRCSITQATSQIRDAHHAVVDLPRMFAHLEAGDLPEDYHRFLLRQVRRLDADQIRLVDEHLAGVEIPSIPRSTFEAQVRLAVASVGNELKPPREAREVRIDGVDSEQGVAWITITGPIPEIRSLGLRLDASARAVQRAQRVALEAGEEEPIPFDLDGDVRDRERPLSLSALRYAILTRTMLD